MRILPRLPEWTIRSRIALTIFAASTAVLMVMAAAIYVGFRKSLLDNFDDGLHARAVANVNLVDVRGPQPSLRLSGATQEPSQEDVTFVRLYNGAGELLAGNLATSALIPSEDGLVASALRGSTMFVTVKLDSFEFRVIAVPVIKDGAAIGALITGSRRDSVYETSDLLETVLFIAIPATAAVLAVLAFLIARRALRPVHNITAAARSIAAGDLSQRIGGVASRDEVGELAATFNAMIGRLEETIERERRFTGDASHELRTPLTAMEAALDVTLSQERRPEEYRNALQSVRGRTGQMTRMVRQLLLLSRMDANALQLEFTTIHLDELLEAVLDSFGDAHPEAALSWDLHSADAKIDGNAELLAVAFTNVLQNCVVHGGPAAQIHLELAAKGNRATVAIRDNGPGIPREFLPTIMQRFARGNASQLRTGAGLGLAIVESIVRLHNGTVAITSDSAGTTVAFDFPAALLKP